ncbi:MAG: T9SS type A sorting domain-containing protein [Bacteroidetes bacterium]|nr:T9SS type A sorting domain-containing protein [Bacteroidota bacterium]
MMKKIYTLLFLGILYFGQSQVSCSLTYERTLQGFDVYIHNPSGATMYRAKMYIDADGSPRAYGPNNSGLDYTANAGYTGNWWALVTDASGNPILQGASDPYPGMYVSTTSLVNSHYASANPLRYVNSETVPFIAMPTNVLASGNIIVGDVAYVYNTTTGQSCFAIYADAGNTTSIGEASILTASLVGVNPNVRTGGTSAGIIDYVVFPHSGFGQGYIPTIAQIDSIGNARLYGATVGGPCIVSCLGPMFDQTAPTTQVTTPAGWDTTAFTASFTDADNNCLGIERRFYQVSDLNASNDWRANSTHGFFNDDFNGPSINSDWTQAAGTWSINAGQALVQSDQVSSNTNLYASLTQTLSNTYLYNWAGTMGGTGTTRRAGFHFFVDQPDSSNRGNSYFVWFRLDDDKIQIYEVTNNSWGSGPVKDTAYNFTANQTYDFKVLYDRITGLIRVYVNNVKSAEWTDATPISGGGYVSFRSASCTYTVDNFKVYRSRNATASITVGAGNTYDVRYQNPNPATPSGHVNSLVTDPNGNISSVATQTLNIDYTHPVAMTVIKDGTGGDIDTTYNGSQLQANWTSASDPNSAVTTYYYAIGTAPGAGNVVNWTSNGNNTAVTVTGLSLVPLQTYYVSVQAQDGALMKSSVVTSDGQKYVATVTGVEPLNQQLQVAIYPNPNAGQFTISSYAPQGHYRVSVVDVLGNVITEAPLEVGQMPLDISSQSNGIYYVIITRQETQQRFKVIVSR